LAEEKYRTGIAVREAEALKDKLSELQSSSSSENSDDEENDGDIVSLRVNELEVAKKKLESLIKGLNPREAVRQEEKGSDLLALIERCTTLVVKK